MAIYGEGQNIAIDANVTLVHEDIYVYVDPVQEITDTKTAANDFTFTNDAIEQTADIGVFELTVMSGNYSNVVITIGNKTSTINVALAAGEKMVLDFRNRHFMKGGSMYFVDNDIGNLNDNDIGDISIALTGTGSVEITRRYEKAQLNNNDIWFLESVSVDTSYERPKKIIYNGQEKNLKGEKKVHSFSINGLWSQDELRKFANKFRMRLVTEDGVKLETLANCAIGSISKNSSSGGDFTYAISGSCEQIF